VNLQATVAVLGAIVREMSLAVQEARQLNIGGLMTATTYIARLQALDVTGAPGLSTSILFTTPLLQTSANGSYPAVYSLHYWTSASFRVYFYSAA